jgi:hypothetical protein
MATPDDQDVEDVTPQSALAALASPGGSPEGREWATNYLKAHPGGIDTQGEAAIFQNMDADAQEARTALQKARERLASQRMDPSVLGLRFAQAMMSPSKGGVPDQWSKAIGSVADWRQQNQEFQRQQGAEDLDLSQKLAGVDQQSLKARLALQELKERTGATSFDTALKVLAKPTTRGPLSPIGKLVEDKLGVGSLQTAAGQKLFDAYQAESRQAKTPAGGGDIPPELQAAIEQGRLDPSRLNSRTVSIYAQLAKNNSQLNFNQMIADAALQKNAAFEQKAMSMETLPETMKNMTDLGKKVGYDDLKFAGRAEKWFKGETNDPDLTKYMTVRNDALMNIASVMRGVGMSDKAHEAEIEAASATMSPKALDAWFEGQMLALGPRLKKVQRVSHLGDPNYSPAGAAADKTPTTEAVSLDAYLKKQGY